MTLETTLKSRSMAFYFLMIVIGIINSVLYAFVLVFINAQIHGQGQGIPVVGDLDWLAFISMICFSLLVNRFFQAKIIQVSAETLINFELFIFRKLQGVSVETFEKMGKERVYTALMDVSRMGNVQRVLFSSFNAVIAILCGIVYMFLQSLLGGAVIITVMIILLVFYTLRNSIIDRELMKMRKLNEDFYRYVRDFLDGFKEIKMSSVRNNSIVNEKIVGNMKESKKLLVSTSKAHLVNELVGNYSWYLVIAIILFALPVFFKFDSQQIISFVIAILFIMGPTIALITNLSFYNGLMISYKQLKDFDNRLATYESSSPSHTGQTKKTFSRLDMKNIIYQYAVKGEEEPFSIGPIDFSISRGEIVFITGGNGSGKSTFVNILSGLYQPTSGEILVNGEYVSDIWKYRTAISSIFTDTYLFTEDYNGFDLSEANTELTRYISLMKMESKFLYSDEVKLSPTARNNDLSKGQRKRIAFIHMLLENKDILVLDEWAADQDPIFRQYFYMEVLPLLKSEGKTLVLVTHDDRYYGAADRIVKFEFGKLFEDARPVEFIKSLN